MVDDVTYHRSLRRRGRKDDFFSELDAYQFQGENLIVVQCVRKDDQDFESYATDWEKTFSELCSEHEWAEPIVDDKLMVIGHYMWAQGNHQVFVEPDASGRGGGSMSLDEMLRSGRKVYVATVKRSSLDSDVGVSDFSWRVITDPDGEVTGYTGFKNRDGAISMAISPVDIFLIGKLVMTLGRKMIGKVIARLASRRAAQEAGSTSVRLLVSGAAEVIATRPVGRITAEEMEQYLARLMQRPELKSLVNARGLQGEALKRETLKALQQWEGTYGRTVRFVDEGVASRISGTYPSPNVMHLSGNELLVEKQVLENPAEFFDETVHEMAADALEVRGRSIGADQLAFVGSSFNQFNNALFALENAIKSSEGLAGVIRFLRGG